MLVRDFAIEPMKALVVALLDFTRASQKKISYNLYESPLVDVYGALVEFDEEGGTAKEIDCTLIDEALKGEDGKIDYNFLIWLCNESGMSEDYQDCLYAHYLFVRSDTNKPLW